MIGIHQATDADNVTSLVLGDGGADLGHASYDLMAGDTGVGGLHDTAPLVAGRVQVGMADAAEKDLDLYIACGRISAWDGGGGQW